MGETCRQCGQELAAESRTGFCSRDCWQDYKARHFGEIAPERQATTLLRSDEVNRIQEYIDAEEEFGGESTDFSQPSRVRIEATPEEPPAIALETEEPAPVPEPIDPHATALERPAPSRPEEENTDRIQVPDGVREILHRLSELERWTELELAALHKAVDALNHERDDITSDHNPINIAARLSDLEQTIKRLVQRVDRLDDRTY